MAKYDITYSCGHTGCVTLPGKRSERERMIKWYEHNGMCRECYQEYMREKPLILTATNTRSYSDRPITLIWSGPTYYHKEEIKELGGYRWTEHPKNSSMAWIKSISFDELDTEIERALHTIKGVKAVDAINYGTLVAHMEKQAKKIQKEAEIKKKIAAIPKPSRPASMSDGYWNGSIYGNARNGYSIYINGNKVSISEADTKDIKKYIQEKKDYIAAIAQVKKLYSGAPLSDTKERNIS